MEKVNSVEVQLPGAELVPISCQSSLHMSLPLVDIILKDETAVVSPNAILRGRVTIGPGCVIHPNASIIAYSPIELGANNIVEEQVIITNTQASTLHTTTLRIGDNNLFEVGAYFENSHCGNLNVFESKSRCIDHCMIGDGTIVGAGVRLVSENVGDKTIIFSGGSAISKPISRKLGILTVEEAAENHNLHLSTVGGLLES